MRVSLITEENKFSLYNIEHRKPKGFFISPYPFPALIRYFINYLFNGLFSYRNPDRNKMELLGKKGRIIHKKEIQKENISSVKIVFLGDIMVTKTGKPPSLNEDLKRKLLNADVIVANVEAPVVKSKRIIKRGTSLKFEMQNSYLKSLYACNQSAKWVFSIANNHACDTSTANSKDISGIEKTIENIHKAIPSSEIIGAEIGSAKSVLSLQVENGPRIGIIAWTELMNRHKLHFQKKFITDTDLTEEVIAKVKEEHDYLIGFPHGNEEQSYFPLKPTRDRWVKWIDPQRFDAIIGHGPHVVQPAELVHSKGLLFHSIGNFCSPKGGSQTKIGCIPKIKLNYQDGKTTSIDYRIHLLQQKKERVSLLTEKNILYPNIIKRFKKMWPNLF